MFTGLVEGMATLVDSVVEGAGRKLTFTPAQHPDLSFSDVKLGDSIAIDGCCLTVIAIDGTRWSFEAGEETLSKTGLGGLQKGDSVNFERSLKVGDRMGGHFVTGHVDGRGTLVERKDDGTWSYFYFETELKLLRQMASKGSITINGVSLTLVDVDDHRFSIALIPHTLSVTTLGRLRVGDRVNLETDILAKYVQRIAQATTA